MADALAAAKAAALQELLGGQIPTVRKRPRVAADVANGNAESEEADEDAPEVVPAPLVPDVPETEKEQYGEMFEVMKRFSERGQTGEGNVEADAANALEETKPESTADDGKTPKESAANETGDTDGKAPAKRSRREKKQDARNLIARLKSLAERPEVVDAWDVSAQDPLLLVHLKSRLNSVAVPANWRQKRKYLQNKRGMEKRAFVLPSYIQDTGVGALRDAQLESDGKKTLKQKQREKMRAKTGKGVEVDEMVMHDAFFKFQTKPRLSAHGDVYYELRELEVDHSKFKPGYVSATLRTALGITGDEPPPWLINMQRFGPPPGYPDLKIPGLNAPIPHGAVFGYQPGGWGKPPVDMNGRPIYGDVFGEGREHRFRDARFDASAASKKALWGEMKVDVQFFKKALKDDDKADSEEKTQGEVPTAAEKKAVDSGTLPDVPDPGLPATAAALRKGLPEGALYTVLPEKRASVGQTDRVGSSHVYDMSGGIGAGGADSQRADEIEAGTVTGVERQEMQVRKRSNDAQESERAKKAQKNFKF